MRIRAINGTAPHPSYGGWKRFLSTCEVRDTEQGVVYYGKSNCNYILLPNGWLIQNYGYHGRVLMESIRKDGVEQVMKRIRANNLMIRRIMRSLR